MKNRQDAEKITTEFLKPVFGFALKRCGNLQDAQDLSQEIILRAYRTLIERDDIEDAGKFIWAIAHNVLSNYYRGQQKLGKSGVTLDEIGESFQDMKVDIEGDLIQQETINRLQKEIAYLSRLQRRIVIAYYYENKKQDEIAAELEIPVGTVKWHLFEAKKDLKRGMKTMRKATELKFNPIKFEYCGTSGSIGTQGNCGVFFRSVLSQNIAYAVWKEAMTINQIADALGVSPVYVENEVEHLEKYGFLIQKGDKYLCNILLDERTSEINRLQDEMYDGAAKIFANELYDELMQSDIWEDPKLYGGYTEEPGTGEDAPKDKNFYLWALIPYIAAMSGEKFMVQSVSFEQAATRRPDGGHNICQASVLNPEAQPVKYADSMHQWYGPWWHKADDITLWQIHSEWSDTCVDDMIHFNADRIVADLKRFLKDERIDADEYAYLIEKGYLKTVSYPEERIETGLQAIVIDGTEMKQKLIDIGDKIREKHLIDFEALKKPFHGALLRETPKQLLTMQKFVLQFLFCSDGCFLLHCMKELVSSGKLKLPTEAQKRALMTVVVRD